LSVVALRQICLAGAATATAERAQLIDRVDVARHKNCDNIHAVDGRARLYSLQKCAKTLYMSTPAQ